MKRSRLIARLIKGTMVAALLSSGAQVAAEETGATDSKASQAKTAATTSKKRSRHDGEVAAKTSATAGDNTAVNKRDRNDREVTADQQTNEHGDVSLAANIRQALVKDDTLSTSAHNVKIIVQDGAVTLKGPVKSSAEKAAVEKKARELAGHGKVTSQMDVVP